MTNEIKDDVKLIVVRAGSLDFGIDMMSVREIRGWSEPTPLPQAPHYLRGMVQLRGVVIPVIDLCDRLGLGRAAPSAISVLVVVEHKSRPVGLLVDSVSDLVLLPHASLQPPPQVTHDPSGAFIAAMVALDGRILSILRLDCVIAELQAAAG